MDRDHLTLLKRIEELAGDCRVLREKLDAADATSRALNDEVERLKKLVEHQRHEIGKLHSKVPEPLDYRATVKY